MIAMIRTALRTAAALVGAGLISAGLSYDAAHAQAPAGTVQALTGARVIDGTGAAPLEGATILIGADGRIQAVGTNVAIPAGAARVDMAGKTIVPGLVNAHGHLQADMSNRPVRDRLAGQLRMYADYGITTVQVLGIPLDMASEALKLRDESLPGRGAPDRARVYVAAASLRNLKTEQEARDWANKYADMKVDIIKMHITGGPMDMTPAVYGALIDQAHKRGIRTGAHLFYLRDAKGLLDKGIDVIAHSIRDQPVDQATIAAIKARDDEYIPTLTRDIAQFIYEGTPPYYSDPFFTRHIPGSYYRDEMAKLKDPANQEKIKKDPTAQSTKAALAQGRKNLKTLSDAGVTIALGTDTGTNEGQWQGYFEHLELEEMVKSGLTPMQALVAATTGAARAANVQQQLGSIAVGKQADLLVLNANPVTDIRNTRQIHSVWIGGRRLAGLNATN
jgi:imidazolonepropionase-like amidohydrolase